MRRISVNNWVDYFSVKLGQRVKGVRLSLAEARSEIFLICRFANIPCWEVSVKTSLVRAVFPAVCLCLFLVLGGDVSVKLVVLMVVVVVENEEEKLAVVSSL